MANLTFYEGHEDTPQDSWSNPFQGGEDDGGPSLAKSSKTPTHAKQDVQMTWLRSKRTKPG